MCESLAESIQFQSKQAAMWFIYAIILPDLEQGLE
jgi:hypothetical protein